MEENSHNPICWGEILTCRARILNHPLVLYWKTSSVRKTFSFLKVDLTRGSERQQRSCQRRGKPWKEIRLRMWGASLSGITTVCFRSVRSAYRALILKASGVKKSPATICRKRQTRLHMCLLRFPELHAADFRVLESYGSVGRGWLPVGSSRIPKSVTTGMTWKLGAVSEEVLGVGSLEAGGNQLGKLEGLFLVESSVTNLLMYTL